MNTTSPTAPTAILALASNAHSSRKEYTKELACAAYIVSQVAATYKPIYLWDGGEKCPLTADNAVEQVLTIGVDDFTARFDSGILCFVMGNGHSVVLSDGTDGEMFEVAEAAERHFVMATRHIV